MMHDVAENNRTVDESAIFTQGAEWCQLPQSGTRGEALLITHALPSLTRSHVSVSEWQCLSSPRTLTDKSQLCPGPNYMIFRVILSALVCITRFNTSIYCYK